MGGLVTYSLGLDIGTNSIGWCLIGYSDDGIADQIKAIGVRIFSDGRDPKSKSSLAVARREKRAMRRSRDRYLRRRQALLNLLVEYDLLPKDKAERKQLELVNPYTARAAALDSKLPLYQVGRALFHLNQRRGFKSNRKTDKGDPESGKIALATSKLREALHQSGARTFGEFLAQRLQDGLPLRIRMSDHEGPEKANGEASEGYAFYPDRALLEEEFRAIWITQQQHYPDALTPERLEILFQCVFFQRPLRQPEVGRCMLLGTERRLAKSDPLFQKRRLLEELNALTIERGPGIAAERLTVDQRDKLLMTMHGKRAVAFTSLRKTLKLGDAVFNKERAGRDKLLGDEVFAELAHKDRFGPFWSEVPLERQREIVSKLRDEQDSETLVVWLMSECELDEDRARRVAGASLPEGYGRVGETASRALIRELAAPGKDGRVIVYSEAVERAPELGHHSDFRTGEVRDELPYYGEILERHIIPGTGDPADENLEKRLGKLTNPTVHIGLNQLRRLMNAIIRAYGHPSEIVVELARDLKTSDEQKKAIQARQKRDLQDALLRGQKLQELGQPDTGANRALLKLWEQLGKDPLDRRCIYTGQVIGAAMLFSGAVDIDHILPWSRTLDDSNANKLVCLAGANRIKRNRTPFEAWGGSPEWEAILQRAERLPRNMSWRFNPDAMKKFGDESGFLARHLIDTQHLSRLAKQYLEAVAPDRVWVSTGKLTAMLRRHWGLNSLLPDHNYAKTVHEKNRTDHRHHAIDAAVVGVLSLSLIQKVAREAGLREAKGVQDVIGSIADPWENFRIDLGDAVKRIVVSHRADHGSVRSVAGKRSQQTAGGLHNDTAYGLTRETDEKGNRLVVHRIALSAIKPSHLEESGARIRDDQLRGLLRDATQGLTGKDFEQAVLTLAHTHKDFRGMRRVRVIEPLLVIGIKDREGHAYKGYKGDANYRYDVWRLPDDKWVADVVSMFDAHSPQDESQPRRPHPAAKRVLSLHQDDLLKFEHPKMGEVIGRIVKFGQNGQLTLAAHNEAGELKSRDALPDAEDPFKYYSPTAGGLKKAKARQIRIDEIGRVWDPGPRE
ncbi:MAG: type II CRISPR RNA-guided endonuclease Cas9 [Alphaproteobacteria bacterium]|nr:type II CRISPR RNA-guided endonuclease Cas9 [Alphaproteobacteria bacterium]